MNRTPPPHKDNPSVAPDIQRALDRARVAFRNFNRAGLAVQSIADQIEAIKALGGWDDPAASGYDAQLAETVRALESRKKVVESARDASKEEVEAWLETVR
jgi:hypothetical protein